VAELGVLLIIFDCIFGGLPGREVTRDDVRAGESLDLVVDRFPPIALPEDRERDTGEIDVVVGVRTCR